MPGYRSGRLDQEIVSIRKASPQSKKSDLNARPAKVESSVDQRHPIEAEDAVVVKGAGLDQEEHIRELLSEDAKVIIDVEAIKCTLQAASVTCVDRSSKQVYLVEQELRPSEKARELVDIEALHDNNKLLDVDKTDSGTSVSTTPPGSQYTYCWKTSNC